MSYQQLALHKLRAHKQKDPIRLCVPVTLCLVCSREFHTRERMFNHVKYKSSVCRNNLLIRGPLISEEKADSLDQAVSTNVQLQCSGHRRHHVLEPSCRLQGPLHRVLLVGESLSDHHPLGRGHNLHWVRLCHIFRSFLLRCVKSRRVTYTCTRCSFFAPFRFDAQEAPCHIRVARFPFHFALMYGLQDRKCFFIQV